ncbi:MAG: hypothetical protein O6933_05725 [Planctomycetota bacterium]|nr:hypothetical protein [Planctomycetota bacterium]
MRRRWCAAVEYRHTPRTPSNGRGAAIPRRLNPIALHRNCTRFFNIGVQHQLEHDMPNLRPAFAPGTVMTGLRIV